MEPARDCPKCPRLVAYRQESKLLFPDGYNGPVPVFGDLGSARLLIVGLAPGLRGANVSGRPFTGDFAGHLLYSTLLKFGFAQGVYGGHTGDGLVLHQCAITNAVRCVPPQNKPLPQEAANCRPFLMSCLTQATNLQAILALGRFAHEAVIRGLLQRLTTFAFSHGARHQLSITEDREVILWNTYHCSRYNTNTGVLTEAMFQEIVARISAYLN